MFEKTENKTKYFSFTFSFIVVVSLIYQAEVIVYRRFARENVSLPGINNLPQVMPEQSSVPSSSSEKSNKDSSALNATKLPDEKPPNDKSASETVVQISSPTAGNKVLDCDEVRKLLLLHGYARSGCNGRLGNQLGVLALGLAINLQFGAKLAFHHNQARILSHAFDMEKVCKKDGSSFCVTIPKNCDPPEPPPGMTISAGSRENLWKKELKAIGQVPGDVQGKKINLPTYPVFLPWIAKYYHAEFRSRVVFKKDIWEDAQMVFDELNKMHGCDREKGCISVFVHMRMGDYGGHMRALRWGPDVFEYTNYLQDAFKNVTKTYENPVFYVIGWTNSDVEAFFESHKNDFKGMKVVIVAPIQYKLFQNHQKNLIGIDLALMAMSDVLVMSYGSYGDFGALFGKDKQMVLYPKSHKTHDETGVNLGIPRFVPIPWTEKDVTRN